MEATGLSYLNDLRGLMIAAINNAIRRWSTTSPRTRDAISAWIGVELSTTMWQLRSKEDVMQAWAAFQQPELRTILTSATMNFLSSMSLEYGEDAYEHLLKTVTRHVAMMSFCAFDEKDDPIENSILVDKGWVASTVESYENLESVYRINGWLLFLITKDMLGVRIQDLDQARAVVASDQPVAEGKQK